VLGAADLQTEGEPAQHTAVRVLQQAVATRKLKQAAAERDSTGAASPRRQKLHGRLQLRGWEEG
jgi:hypothetical protein